MYGCTVGSVFRGEIGVGRQHMPIPDVGALPQDSGLRVGGSGFMGWGLGLGVYGYTVE